MCAQLCFVMISDNMEITKPVKRGYVLLSSQFMTICNLVKSSNVPSASRLFILYTYTNTKLNTYLDYFDHFVCKFEVSRVNDD